MSVQVQYLGHSCVLVEAGGTRILLDPFLTGNPAASTTADAVEADFIVVSHGHGDHVGDTVGIAKRTGATVISNYEICEWLAKQGVAKGHAMHLGGAYRFPFGRLKLTVAHHGSALPDGSYGGSPAGIHLFLDAGLSLYFAGDTALFGDMRLIAEEGIDLAILPIGDNFTMGPDDALRAVKLLGPRKVMPIHYNTWPLIAQDAEAWAARVRDETDVEALVVAPGSSITL
jgi:L-ascorbate metabolism protein UlaG (beta-lactamase superfamily)